MVEAPSASDKETEVGIMIVAAIVGIVVGYGLALWRESRRTRLCERDCATLRQMRQQQVVQDLTLVELFQANGRLAEMLTLQNACDRTRLEARR